MTFQWDSIPALRVLLPYMIGIGGISILSDYCYFQTPIFALTGFLLVGLLLLRLLKRPLQQRRYEWLFGLLGSLALVGLGYSNAAIQDGRCNDPQHFTRRQTDSSFVVARLLEPIAEKERTYKAVVEIKYILSGVGATWPATTGKAIFYLQKDSSNRAAQLQYGDFILTNATLKPVTGALNPAGFDYAAYLAMSGIYHQAYVSDIHWEKLGLNQGSAFWRWIYNLRDYCIQVIETYIDSGDPYCNNQTEQAVALALLIGNTDLIDDDILQAYSHTGAMHILAVSGMHVAIFWLLLNWLLGFLDKYGRKGRLTKAVLCLFAIWTFALVSGFSPSVARAAVMFTLVLVGQQLNYQANAYNTMAVAALFLLALYPLTLFHVGLQLSFLAVLGIVYFQSKIKQLLSFTINWGQKCGLFLQAFLPLFISRSRAGKKIAQLPAYFGKQIGELSAATLSAQIATMPLTLYYFHQFPVYFMLANLLAVPLSGFALYSGFALLFVGKWVWIATIVGKLTYWLIYFTNQALLFMGHLPGAVINGFAISWAGMVLLYLLTVALTGFFMQKDSRFLKWAALLTLIGLWGVLLRQYKIAQQHELVCYHIANGTAVDLVAGNKVVSITDSIGATDKANVYYKQPYRQQLGVTQIEDIPINTLQWQMAQNNSNASEVYTYKNNDVSIFGQIVNFSGQTVFFFNNKHEKFDPTDTLQIDYLYLCGNAFVDLSCLAEKVHFKHVIIDASNSQWRIDRWAKQLDELGVAYYSIKNNKALTLKW